ncbi:MAG: NmrA family transcriptional regulator [Sphingopyxis sp.]|nr:NmrA family transcriptional regulator [Sphingopyxis sp.]
MKITILGGTGLIGRRLAALLRAQGHEVTAAARSTGVDLVTGQGLAAAVSGADVVVDASNAGYAQIDEMERFFTASTAHLVAAVRDAGVPHLVALSAVGVDTLAGGYYRAKRSQELQIVEAGLAYTIVRSTPFFEFVYKIVDAGGEGELVRLPPVQMQPIAADDVAAALARVAFEPPAGDVVEVAGPGRYSLSELALEILTANEDPRYIVVDPDALYFGAAFDGEPLTGTNPRVGKIRFDDWLRDWFAMAA